jgi:hypothetical protein
MQQECAQSLGDKGNMCRFSFHVISYHIVLCLGIVWYVLSIMSARRAQEIMPASANILAYRKYWFPKIIVLRLYLLTEVIRIQNIFVMRRH